MAKWSIALSFLVACSAPDRGDDAHGTSQPLVSTEEAAISVADAIDVDYFGLDVEVSDDGSLMVASSSRWMGDRGRGLGRVHVFRRTGENWTEEGTLSIPDGEDDDRFGSQVEISADGTRVFASQDISTSTTGPIDAGVVRVYARSGGTWGEEASLHPSDRVPGDGFGGTMASSADGARLLVGAYRGAGFLGPGRRRAGSAYVFVRTGRTWAEEAILLPSGAVEDQSFGWQVAITADGSLALVSATGEDVDGAVAAGAVRVFARSGETWTEQARLVHPVPRERGAFGQRIALSADGTRALVVARAVDGGLEVLVFRRAGVGWTFEDTIVDSSSEPSPGFASDIATSADGARAIVGVSRATTAAATASGSARVFLRSGATWAEDVTLGGSILGENAYFGHAVAIDAAGGRIAVGAYSGELDEPDAHPGRVFVFRLSDEPTPTQQDAGSPTEDDAGEPPDSSFEPDSAPVRDSGTVAPVRDDGCSAVGPPPASVPLSLLVLVACACRRRRR